MLLLQEVFERNISTDRFPITVAVKRRAVQELTRATLRFKRNVHLQDTVDQLSLRFELPPVGNHMLVTLKSIGDTKGYP